MSTTQFDLLRDDLIDLLVEHKLTRVFNSSNNGDGDDTEVDVDFEQAVELVEYMLDALTDNGVDDYNATPDQIAKHLKYKTVSTDYGDIIPGDIIRESEVL